MPLPTPYISYYVATSLDGFIAQPDGGIDWLSCVEVDGEDYGYNAFFDSVDGLLIGRTTFEHVLQQTEWPYGDKPCWVWTQRPLHTTIPCIMATNASPTVIVQTAQLQGLTHLWLVGGGKLAAAFEAERLINRYIISIVPVVLGSGIALFDGVTAHARLVLKHSHCYASGLMQLTYEPKR